jgi:RNA polymerase sigma-70 factor (ECF subfamily)
VNNDYAEDVHLMTLVAAADPSAQRRLDGRLRARSLRIARSLLRNEADATDASQISMLEIFKSAKNYRGESSLERWADRIVVRTSVRALSERRSWSVSIEGAISPDDVAAPATHAAHTVLEYLEQLPPPMRTVLVLKYALEYSVDEIAAVTGVSVNTVKDRLLRAKHAIRRVIRRDQVPFGGQEGFEA